MSDSTDLARAEARSREARARLFGTIGEVKARLSPPSLAHNLAEKVQDSATGLALKAVDGARKRPALAGALLAGLGLFLARKQVGAAFSRKSKETPDPQPGLKPRRARRPKKGQKT
jgi:hypothetical protein